MWPKGIGTLVMKQSASSSPSTAYKSYPIIDYKSNQFIAQHNIIYKNSGHKIIQAYHYGCTMESDEAKLLEP